MSRRFSSSTVVVGIAEAVKIVIFDSQARVQCLHLGGSSAQCIVKNLGINVDFLEVLGVSEKLIYKCSEVQK